MRSYSAILVLVALAPLAGAQSQQSPQTARQALIEMFFGTGAGHFEKHLPDATRNTLQKLNSPNGMSVLDEFSAFAAMAKTGGAKFETFDSGPNLLVAEDSRQGQRVEISVEGDDLSGEEDRIEVALHMTQNAKEQTLPFVPRFTFVMKTESEVWRLSEIVVTLKVPLADPNFLKTLEDRQRGQNEQAALWGMRSVINAEKSAYSMRGSYACSLSELARVSSMSADGKSATVNMLGSDLAGGKSGGYVFAITACDGNKYKIAAEPAVPGSGQRAFCSDESGTIRASSDGKATTCVSTGEPVQEGQVAVGLGAAAASPASPTRPSGTSTADTSRAVGSRPAQRVRVSQGVMQSMIVSKVQPVYPPEAKAARVQGAVIFAAIIAKDGTIQSLRVLNTPSPLLTQAAMDAVQQWTYRPYLLNGTPVEVDTQITVNFTLSMR